MPHDHGSLRILHLVSYSLFSGPLPSTVGLALAQRRLGCTTWLAFDNKRGAFNDFEEAAAPRLADMQLQPPLPLTLSAKSTLGELWRDWRSLRTFFSARQVDVVHVHMSHDHVLTQLAWPRGARAVRVRTVHAARSLERRFGQTFLNGRADAFITRCEEHRRLLVERFGVADNRAHRVPGGIDASFFVPADSAQRARARRRFGLPEDAPVLGHVALIAGRGQREVVEALALLPVEERPYVLFVGRGEAEAALRARVVALGLVPWVRYAGYLLGDDLLSGYAAMDAAFVAQPGNDGSARAALEAMACGLPTVAVAVGALGELVTEERGYPITDRAPPTVAFALRQLFAGTQARQRARAGRSYVQQQRSFDGEAQATLEVYQGAFARRDTPAELTAY